MKPSVSAIVVTMATLAGATLPGCDRHEPWTTGKIDPTKLVHFSVSPEYPRTTLTGGNQCKNAEGLIAVCMDFRDCMTQFKGLGRSEREFNRAEQEALTSRFYDLFGTLISTSHVLVHPKTRTTWTTIEPESKDVRQRLSEVLEGLFALRDECGKSDIRMYRQTYGEQERGRPMFNDLIYLIGSVGEAKVVPAIERYLIEVGAQ